MDGTDSTTMEPPVSPNKPISPTAVSPSLTDTSEQLATTEGNSPASLPSSAATPQEALNALICPASPLLSPSEWKNMDPEGLRHLLSEAHGIIREKERDLTLAAEIGRDLVTSNDELKKRNQDLSKQVKQRSTPVRTQRLSPSSPTGPTDRAISPIPSMALDSPSLMMAVSNNSLSDGDDARHLHGDPSGSEDGSSAYDPMRSPRRTLANRTTATARYDQERIDELEQQNADLQARLEQAHSDAEHARKASARRAKKVEQELASTRRELERAHERVSELEEELKERKAIAPTGVLATSRRGRVMNRTRTHGPDDDLSGSEFDSEDEDGLDAKTLRRRFVELEAAHNALVASKRIVNERLGYTQQELRSAKQKNVDLESRIRALSHLEEECERQTSHISQLQHALDEQRRFALGEFSPSLAPVPPPVAQSPDLTAEGLRRRGKNLMDEFERGRSLMDEFEMVLFRGADAAANGQAATDHSTDSLNGVDTLFQTLAGAARAGSQNEPFGNFMLDDLVGAVGQATFGNGEGVLTKATQEDRSFFGLLRSFLGSVWRWFRFLTILWCAVVVSVYRGPAREITSH